MTNKKYKGLYYETPMFLGYIFLAILFTAVLIYLFKKPLASQLVIIPEAKAQEYISCEDPKGYLECESRWNDQAVNVNSDGSIDRGVFQLNSKWHKSITNEESFNFKKNIDYGIKLYKKQGVKPWVCARILKIK